MDRERQINGQRETDKWTERDIVLTTHRLAYLCCQCDASIDMKLAPVLVVARNER